MNAISAYSYSFENSQYRPICDWLWQDSFLSLHIYTSSSFHHLIAQVWCLSQWGLRDDIFKAFVLQFMNLSASPLLCFLWKSKASTPSVGDEPTNQIAGFEIVLITDFILRLHVTLYLKHLWSSHFLPTEGCYCCCVMEHNPSCLSLCAFFVSAGRVLPEVL